MMNEQFKKGVQRALVADVVREYFQQSSREGRVSSVGEIRDGIASLLTLRAPSDAQDLLVEYGLSRCLADGRLRPLEEVGLALGAARQMAHLCSSRPFIHLNRLQDCKDLRYMGWTSFANVVRGEVTLRITNLNSGHVGVWRCGTPDRLLFTDKNPDLVSDFVLLELGLAQEVKKTPRPVTPVSDWMSDAQLILRKWGDPPEIFGHGTFLSLRRPEREHPAIVSRTAGDAGSFQVHMNTGLVAEGSLDYVLRCALEQVETDAKRRLRVRRAFAPLRASAALGSIGLRDRMYERWCEVGLDNSEGQASMWEELRDLYPDACAEGVPTKDLIMRILGASPNSDYPCTTHKMPSYEVEQNNLLRSKPLDGRQVVLTTIKSREAAPGDVMVVYAHPKDLKPVKLVEQPAQHQRPEICDWYWVDSDGGGKRLAQVEVTQEPKAPHHAWVRWHVEGNTSLVSWSRLTTRALAPIPYGETRAIGKDLPYDEVDP